MTAIETWKKLTPDFALRTSVPLLVAAGLAGLLDERLEHEVFIALGCLTTSARDGGAEGSRTPDLLIANETLYQLSYDPIQLR